MLLLYLDASTNWQVVSHVMPGGLGLLYKNCKSIEFDSLVETKKIMLQYLASAPIQASALTISAEKSVLGLIIKKLIQQAHGTFGELFEFLIENLKNAYWPIAWHIYKEIQAALTINTSMLGPIVKESIQQAYNTFGELFRFLIKN